MNSLTTKARTSYIIRCGFHAEVERERDAALAEVTRLQAGGCARDQRAASAYSGKELLRLERRRDTRPRRASDFGARRRPSRSRPAYNPAAALVTSARRNTAPKLRGWRGNSTMHAVMRWHSPGKQTNYRSDPTP